MCEPTSRSSVELKYFTFSQCAPSQFNYPTRPNTCVITCILPPLILAGYTRKAAARVSGVPAIISGFILPVIILDVGRAGDKVISAWSIYITCRRYIMVTTRDLCQSSINYPTSSCIIGERRISKSSYQHCPAATS